MQTWLVNGRLDGAITPDDRGFTYGDGLFETIAFRSGAPRFIERHLARLSDGCRRLGLRHPESGLIIDEMARLAAGRSRGTIKIVVTRGPGPRGYRPAPGVEVTRVVGFAPDADAAPTPWAEGVRVRFCRTPVTCNAVLAGMKTLNRLDNVLARSEWQGGGIAEGLMCDLTGHVIGGTMSNLFLVRQGRLLTPSLNRCGIRGVMRGLVMDSCAAIGVEVEEADIDRQCLADAEELFLTNALIGLWPVNQLEHRPWEIGPLTRAIAAELYVRGVEENGA